MSNAAQADNPTISEFSTPDANRSAEEKGLWSDNRQTWVPFFLKKKKEKKNPADSCMVSICMSHNQPLSSMSHCYINGITPFYADIIGVTTH